MSRNDTIYAKIMRYGNDILESEIFLEGEHQKHHHIDTVAHHSLEVAKLSLKIADRLSKFGIKVNEEALIKASLCHDLGIIGRREKFHSPWQTTFGHPKDSAMIASDITGSNDQIENMIRSHMFPASPVLPKSKEAWILILADKTAPVIELFKSHKH